MIADTRIRFGITSDPEKTTLDKEDAVGSGIPELPFVILLASDLQPGGGDGTGAPRRVDRNTFEAYLAETSPQLSLTMASADPNSSTRGRIKLMFSELRDFEPAGIVSQVSFLQKISTVLAGLRGARVGDLDESALRALFEEADLDPKLGSSLFRSRLEGRRMTSVPKSAPRSDSPSIEHLFGMVDTGEEESIEQDARASVAALAQSLGDESEIVRVDAERIDQISCGLRLALSNHVATILEDTRFRDLERAWRSLRFLVDRLPTRENIELWAVPTCRGELESTIETVTQLVLQGSCPPPALIVADFDFDHKPPDAALLSSLSETVSVLRAAFISGLAPSFFGVDKFCDLDAVQPLDQMSKGLDFAKWRSLRQAETARFVSVAIPHFVLRSAYGPDNSSGAVQVEEHEPLWGRAPLLLAIVIAKRFAKSRWPTYLVGPSQALVGDLGSFESDRGPTALSLRVAADERADLDKAGIAVFETDLGSDAAYLSCGPVLGWLPPSDNAESTEQQATMRCLETQLFLTRLTDLAALAGMGDASAESRKERIGRVLASALGIPSQQDSSASVAVESSSPGSIIVHVRPPIEILPGGTDFSFVMSLS